jgi:hypothetical protein
VQALLRRLPVIASDITSLPLRRKAGVCYYRQGCWSDAVRRRLRTVYDGLSYPYGSPGNVFVTLNSYSYSQGFALLA